MSEVKMCNHHRAKEAILGLLETQRTKVVRWKAARRREIELEADRELAAIERIAGTFDQGARIGARSAPRAAASLPRPPLRLLSLVVSAQIPC